MASGVLRTTRALVKNTNFKWGAICNSSFSTSSFNSSKEPTQIKGDLVFLTPEEVEQKRKLQDYITLKTPVDVSPISHIPEEQLKTRRVRIFIPTKNAMQSGTNNIDHWELEFDNKQRWENPLMGWCSTGDPLSNVKLQFGSKEEAIEYCEKNKWQYYIESKPEKPWRNKSYALNFHWSKRTRTSTK